MSGTAVQTFTLDEARVRLPLVRSIVADILEQYSQMRERLDQYTEIADENGEPPAGSEDIVRRLENDITGFESGIDRALSELESLGAEFKGFDPGLVDFPGVKQGRPICWCWKFDEPDITHWHGVDEGFGGRKPV